MKKSGLFAVAVLLSLSSGVFAAETTFDQSLNDILDTVDTLKAPPGGDHGGFQPGHDNHGGGDQHPGGDHGGFQPGPGNHGGNNPPPPPPPQPFNPGPGHDNHPGDNHGGFQPGPGHDNHPGDNHGGFQPGPGHDNHGGQPPFNPNPGWDNNHGGPNDWDHQHPQPPYHGPVNECTDWTFKSDTPNPFTDKIYFYDYQGQIHDQKVTINVGTRDLKPWESEIITVCNGSLSQDKTLFNYSVAQKDSSGFGSFFTGTKSYEYTLTPTGRKAATPDSQGLSMVSAGAVNNAVNIILSDKWASFYQGQQVTFNVKIMRMPTNVQSLPVQDLINALKETTLSVTYPVSSQYQIQLFNEVVPGTYMVTVDYVRDGASLSQMFTFAI